MQIITSRIILTIPNDNDFIKLSGLYFNNEVRKFLGGVIKKDSINEKISVIKNHWENFSFGMFTVKLINGEIIGACGLHNSEDGIEISYMFFPEYWNKGLAKEAALACLKFAFEKLNLNKVIAITQCKNISSCKLLESIGMKRVDKLIRFNEEQCLFEIYK